MFEVINFFRFDFSSLFSWQVVFLVVLGVFWLLLASVQDFRRREVENWWSFSLVVAVLGFRAFWSVYDWNIWPFLWGLIGLGVGFVIASLFYYARMFAAGDFKLLIALFSIIPFSCLSFDWKLNSLFAAGFIVLLLLMGALYGLVFIMFLMFRNFSGFKKEFVKQIAKNKIYLISGFIFLLFGVVLGFWLDKIFISLGLTIGLASILLVYSKTIEECCMNKFIRVRDLSVGDWLVEKVIAGNKIIKPDWEGLTEEDMILMQTKLKGDKKILVKEGIPFVPAFLLGFLALIYFLI